LNTVIIETQFKMDWSYTTLPVDVCV